MKSTSLIAATLSIALLGASGMALAHDRQDRDHRHDRVEQRDHERRHADRRDRGCFECRLEARLDRQAERIRQGFRSGELTRSEMKRLRKQHRRVLKKSDRLARNGYNRHERKRLMNALDKASKRIRRAKHNDLVRHDRYYGIGLTAREDRISWAYYGH